MKLKPIIIAILEELHMENKFVSLKFLINKLDKYKPSPRTLQSILKELIECNRVIE